MRAYEQLRHSIPPWVTRIIKQGGQGINRFNMIKNNDRILIGISGGKDSLGLAMVLALRRKWIPITYSLEAVHINWIEYPLNPDVLKELETFFRFFEIPYTVINARIFPESFKGEFNCYLCSRNRKRILFEEARKKNIKKIAFGHHLDDMVETTLINICFRGNISTMMPIQEFFNGKLFIIRPLCLVTENSIRRLTQRLDMPVYHSSCPYRDTNIRSAIKPIISNLAHLNKAVRRHIFEAPFNIQSEYLPTVLHETDFVHRFNNVSENTDVKE